jgi:hypothetical protein
MRLSSKAFGKAAPRAHWRSFHGLNNRNDMTISQLLARSTIFGIVAMAYLNLEALLRRCCVPLRKFSHLRTTMDIFDQIRATRLGGITAKSWRRPDLVLPLHRLVWIRSLANKNAATRSVDDCWSCGDFFAFTLDVGRLERRMVVGTTPSAFDPSRTRRVDRRAN